MFVYFVFFWPLVYTLLHTCYMFTNWKQDVKEKVVRNIISGINGYATPIAALTHVGICFFTQTFTEPNPYQCSSNEMSVSGQTMWYSLSLYLPTSYFIWDTYLIVLTHSREYIYLCHHFISLLAMQQILAHADYGVYLYYALICGEISNWPMYIIYHYKKVLAPVKHNSRNMKNLYFIQLALYGCIRVFVLGILLIQALMTFHMPVIVKVSTIVLYLMGVSWARKIYTVYFAKQRIGMTLDNQ